MAPPTGAHWKKKAVITAKSKINDIEEDINKVLSEEMNNLQKEILQKASELQPIQDFKVEDFTNPTVPATPISPVPSVNPESPILSIPTSPNLILPQVGTTALENKLFKYELPVSPTTFVNSAKYYDNDSTHNIYPWVIEEMEEIFSGPYHTAKYSTVCIVAGKGSGKSWFAGMCLAYLWYWYLNLKSFQEYFLLKGADFDDSATITFLGMAPDKSKAREIVFGYAANQIRRVKFFQDNNLLPVSNFKNTLRYKGYNERTKSEIDKLVILPGNSSNTFQLGYNVLGGVIDEAAFWKTEDGDKVVEIYDEMKIRQFNRFGNNGIIFLISSPNVDGDFMEQFEIKAKEDPKVHFKRMATYNCKPSLRSVPRFELKFQRERADGVIVDTTIHPPDTEEYRKMYRDDFFNTLKDIDAIPMLAQTPFYSNPILLFKKANLNREDPCPDLGNDKPEGPMEMLSRLPPWFRGNPNATYRCHVDLAKGQAVKGHCGCGFAMSHKELNAEVNFKVVIDLAVRFKVKTGQDLQVEEVLEFIKQLRLAYGFHIDLVTFDKWNSLMPIQTIKSWHIGIDAQELSVGFKEHNYFKNLLLSDQIDVALDKNLFYELKRLEDVGGQKVMHAPGAYQDEADAVAGSVYSVGAIEGCAPLPPRSFRGALVGRTMNSALQLPRASGPLYRQNMGLGRYRS